MHHGHYRLIATGMAFLLSVPATAFGQSSACTALLAQGIRDTSSQQITEARFNQIKSNVCNSNYDTYAKASSQAMNGGFDLPGVFGISAGSATANSDYSQKWSNFCQANYSLAMENTDLKTSVSTANQSVLHSFDNCVKVTSEQFVRYVEPQSDGKTFAMVFKNKREGTTSFVIEKISLTDSTTGEVLKVQDTCDFQEQLPFDTKPLNSYSIVCRKKAEDTVVVSGITDAGNIDPVSVPGVPGAGPNIGDRVAALEGTAQTLQKSLSVTTDTLNNNAVPRIGTLETALSGLTNRLNNTGTMGKKDIFPFGNWGEKSVGATCDNGQVQVGFFLTISAPFHVVDGTPENKAREAINYTIVCAPK